MARARTGVEDALTTLDFYLAHRRERLEQVREALRSLAEAGAPPDLLEPPARWAR